MQPAYYNHAQKGRPWPSSQSLPFACFRVRFVLYTAFVSTTLLTRTHALTHHLLPNAISGSFLLASLAELSDQSRRARLRRAPLLHSLGLCMSLPPPPPLNAIRRAPTDCASQHCGRHFFARAELIRKRAGANMSSERCSCQQRSHAG